MLDGFQSNKDIMQIDLARYVIITKRFCDDC